MRTLQRIIPVLLAGLLIAGCSGSSGGEGPNVSIDRSALVPLSEVAVGTCVNFDQPPSDRAVVVACGSESAVKIVGEVLKADVGVEYPGAATAAAMFVDQCADAYAKAGVDGVHTVVTIPGEAGWDASRERALCGVTTE